MKSIKLFFLICVAVSFSSCSTLKLTKSAPFTVFGATYHNWVGGQPGVSGTNLIVGVDNDANSTFKKIYFHNKVVDASIENRKGKKYVVANLSTSNRKEMVINEKNNQTKVKKEEIPFNLESNEAVISYIYNKKTYYYKVSKIKQTDTIFYP